MENCLLISIIIPAYNSEKIVRECLDSLINLDYDPNKYEIIIVDDGFPTGHLESPHLLG
jgi:glycosyltransferase involved in cell wall biosynthesis